MSCLRQLRALRLDGSIVPGLADRLESSVKYCLVLYSYNVDSADGTEDGSARLKSCLYREETASTCSDQSQSTLLSPQPSKLVRTTSQKSPSLKSRVTASDRRRADSTDSTKHGNSAACRHKNTTTNIATKPRYSPVCSPPWDDSASLGMWHVRTLNRITIGSL